MENTRRELLVQAVKDYEELKTLINQKDSLEELYKKLGGHNKDLIFHRNMFDLNFKSITVTIGKEDEKIVIFDGIDIWEDSLDTVYEDYSIIEIKKFILEK